MFSLNKIARKGLIYKQLANIDMYLALKLQMPWSWSTKPILSTLLTKYSLYWIHLLKDIDLYDDNEVITITFC